MKEFQLRFKINGEAMMVVEADTFNEAINKIKNMDSDELCNEIYNDYSSKDLNVSDFRLEDILSERQKIRVKVFNIESEDNVPNKSYVLDIEVYNYSGEIEKDNIEDSIYDEMASRYNIDVINCDYTIIKKLK